LIAHDKNRGYTVFAVVHGSQPRFTVPEIIQDMNRAVQFIRYHAHNYGVDSDHIGVSGASAGGYLSFIIHSDKDPLVPLQQSELMIDKLKKAGVETNLVIKKGAGHGWLGLN
jgi:acetyl esterase/lipase